MLTLFAVHINTMRYTKNITTFLALVIILISGGSWGFLGHKTAHQLAVYELPKKMQRFFFKHLDYLEAHAVRPDERRYSDKTEAPKHFIDIESYGDSAEWKMPYTWDEAVAKYSKDSLVKYGYVPYQVLFVAQQLTQAFKAGNADTILFYATDLGHYIEDAHVPLHTSVNYDGQLTNQKGLHALWETNVPETDIAGFNLYSRHTAKYLKHPEQAIWQAVRRAHELLPEVFGKEKELSEHFTESTKYVTHTKNGHRVKVYSAAFSKAYADSLQGTVNRQLLYATDMVADFWYTAWVNAGKPDLSAMLDTPFTKQDKAELRKQIRSYKGNHLLHDSLLLSKLKGIKPEVTE